MTATDHRWQQLWQEIHNACSNRNWNEVIQECNELIRYAQLQSGDTLTAEQSYQSNEPNQQMLIQAHAEQD
ncbi:hypothetical protein [Cohnella yongneupensis]|uniref:Uncharacterized protein n=1 Tax=Cohnella yongneupensis TaxID=425006 RepID=A0ABW0QSY5_9BACL